MEGRKIHAIMFYPGQSIYNNLKNVENFLISENYKYVLDTCT